MNLSSRFYSSYPNYKETYLINGKSPKKGQILNPYLAKTLSIISKKGRKGFYEGEIAEKISEAVVSQGGFISIEDLKNHKSEWIEPVSTNYRGYDIWELPPNGRNCSTSNIKYS